MISRKLIPLLLVSTITANAAVNVNWTSAVGAIKQNGGVTDAPATWYAQLIWSPDNVISPLDGASPLVPTESEVVLKAQALNNFAFAGFLSGGTVDATGLAPSDGVGGFVYTRVFNVDFNVMPSTPTLYGNSVAINGPLAADILLPTPSPQTTSHSPVVTVNQSIVAIPEPSTYALAAVGIAAALWRRRRKA